jgi:hypothetical protein
LKDGKVVPETITSLSYPLTHQVCGLYGIVHKLGKSILEVAEVSLAGFGKDVKMRFKSNLGNLAFHIVL